MDPRSPGKETKKDGLKRVDDVKKIKRWKLYLDYMGGSSQRGTYSRLEVYKRVGNGKG